MTITLIPEKKFKKLNLCQENFREDVVKIRSLSKLIGNLVAASPAVILCPFNCRALEMNRAKNSPTETMILQLDYLIKQREKYGGE